MTCPLSGPNGSDSRQQLYPGFERDVLRTVGDYYQRLKEPLLTFHLYEVFVNILSECWRTWTCSQLSLATADGADVSALHRSAAGPGGSNRGSAGQLSPAATTQQKTPPALAAPHGPGVPQPTAASTQRLHLHTHTGKVEHRWLMSFCRQQNRAQSSSMSV